MAESLPGHDRVGGERAVDDPEQVHAEYPAPVLAGQVAGIAPDADAGVVEQVVQPAVAGGGFLDRLPDGVFAGHVDLARLSPAALADDRLGDARQVAGVDVGDDHCRPRGARAPG